MHDFDPARAERYHEDRQFKLGGEIFTYRPGVKPEKMAAYEDLDLTATAEETLRVVDDLIVSWLDTNDDPTAVERWRAIREREDDPITGKDISDLAVWLYAQTTRRPTQQPSPSGDGSETTGTTSTDGSSPEPVAASTG